MADDLSRGAARTAATLAALRAELAARGLDAFLLPRYDAHQGEYLAPCDERLAHVTGFTGTAGLAVVTADTVALFTDGRYRVQAQAECPPRLFQHYHIEAEPPEAWLAAAVRPGWRVGFDAMLLPPSWHDRFAAALAPTGAALMPLDTNPVDAIWHDRPAPPLGKVWPMPLQYAGRSAADKRAALLAHMAARGAGLCVETQPDNIAWLLNVRGADTRFLPAPQSFLTVDQAGHIRWFVDPAKIGADIADHLPANLTLAPPADFLRHIAATGSGTRVLIDPDRSPAAVRLALQARGAEVLAEPGWITSAKAVKHAAELSGMRACQISDGIAWTEFSAWLADTVPARAAAGKPVSEHEAAERLAAMRAEHEGYLGESFATISASGANAAMCHYHAPATGGAALRPGTPYLLDAGAQYDIGTTDATRVFAFGGALPDGYRAACTAVFRAFHALVSLRFPRGTQGHHIDAIARRPLWDIGADYDHGTGHGVGHCLSVHEHPARLGRKYNPVDLEPGMVMTVEPGLYREGRFGIRLENTVELVEEPDGFLAFRSLTLVPFQTDLLDLSALTAAERAWLSAYHAEVARRIGPHLSLRARTWLARMAS